MTEDTGFPQPDPTPAYVPPENMGSAAAPPPAPDPSQEPPADTPAPESDTAPDAAAEPAPEPGPEAPAEPAAEIPAPFVPDGQPGWLSDLVKWFDDRLRALGG